MRQLVGGLGTEGKKDPEKASRPLPPRRCARPCAFHKVRVSVRIRANPNAPGQPRDDAGTAILGGGGFGAAAPLRLSVACPRPTPSPPPEATPPPPIATTLGPGPAPPLIQSSEIPLHSFSYFFSSEFNSEYEFTVLYL